MSLSSSSQVNWACLRLLLLLVFATNAAFSGTIVKYLPGFDGELPFTLETGYVTVGSTEFFYYFIESEGNPREDAFMIWYSGGPGCSVFNGIIYEIGPLEFNITDYEGGLPTLKYYPYSWTKAASILFVDAPVGTGFSYATDSTGWASSDEISAAQTYMFLKTWLNDHPQFLNNQLFVGADSYSGMSASILTKNIVDGNEKGDVPFLNLKGYILGCPRIDTVINENSKIIFAHRIGLISDELYHAAKDTCGEDYADLSSASPACNECLKLIKKCTKDINKNTILEPKCTWASPHDDEPERRSLEDNSGDFILSPPEIPDLWCHNFNYAMSYWWANDKNVQKALNVREGIVRDWKRCNKSLSYTFDTTSVIDYQRNLSTKRLDALIYNGDHDFTIPSVGTTKWIKVLDLKIINDWRPWYVDGQVAGYTMKYSENGFRMTYASIKGAGHSPQEYKRRECFAMFDRFIHYYPI
ncbi:Peptidase_S10 domain-containing protein [Cephalotus follicularis]|uniref:Peptidase_S10 domain-containing protein n=1 Tax=Cephalotus follicularis TaxID=3775 RepID=A0A1Q3C5P8_CEPFO|nr:Peptidase_S10 domain-containing protein [Cephalotus follicularis]